MNERELCRLAMAWAGVNAGEAARRVGVSRSAVANWLGGAVMATATTDKVFAGLGWACRRVDTTNKRGEGDRIRPELRMLPGVTWRTAAPAAMSAEDLAVWLKAMQRASQRISGPAGEVRIINNRYTLISIPHINGYSRAVHFFCEDPVKPHLDALVAVLGEPSAATVGESDMVDWLAGGARPSQAVLEQLDLSPPADAQVSMQEIRAADWQGWIPLLVDAVRAGQGPAQARQRLGLHLAATSTPAPAAPTPLADAWWLPDLS
jgi:hypothetical protein